MDTSAVPPEDAMLDGGQMLEPGASSYTVAGRGAVMLDAVPSAAFPTLSMASQ